ncbi:MAG: YraN family protein [Actinomycetota bacterium]
MPSVRQVLGAWGEDQVARWYADRGMTVVARNWRSGRGELDLVAVAPDTVVFCEVKTRRTASHGSPFEAVTHDKRRRVRRLALRFLDAHPQHRARVLRFDVAGVTPDGIEVIEAAF